MVALPSFPPSTPPWPGKLDASRPGQFWRLTGGRDESAWGGIYQILDPCPERGTLTLQRWSALPGGPNRLRPIIRNGSPTTILHTDFVSRVTHRLLVAIGNSSGKGTIHAEFSDYLGTTSPYPSPWPTSLRSGLPGGHTWSVYTDAIWRAQQPLEAQTAFSSHGTYFGRGALFLSADFPDWCSHITAVRFDIPPTLRVLGETAQVTELLAIYTGISLLHTLNLRGTVYSDCLAAVKKITRRWTPATPSRQQVPPSSRLPERSDSPVSAWTRQQWGIYVADALAKNKDVSTLPHSSIPVLQTHQISLHDLLSTVTRPNSWQ